MNEPATPPPAPAQLSADRGQIGAVRKVVARVIDLHKDYILGRNVVHALRGVTLEFRQGDFVAIMGASGSGKSTLLNLLGCLDKPTSGRYILAGHDVSQLDDYALSKMRSRYLGFIFQSYNLIPQLSVVENIEIPLQYLGEDSPAARQRCVRLARLVGLGERLHHRPTELSGGQQQRVAIARALVNNPHIILADEPTGNLDSVTGQEIMALLSALNRAGRTIIMVTHEADIAAYARRVIRLRDGRIEDDRNNP